MNEFKSYLHQIVDPNGTPSPNAILGIIFSALTVMYAAALAIYSFFEPLNDTQFRLFTAFCTFTGVCLGGYLGEVGLKLTKPSA